MEAGMTTRKLPTLPAQYWRQAEKVYAQRGYLVFARRNATR